MNGMDKHPFAADNVAAAARVFQLEAAAAHKICRGLL
jgi:hypothetical protein